MPEMYSLTELHTPSECTRKTFTHFEHTSSTNETLVRPGYLGATPEKPTLAFSLDLLRIYRQLRRVCPRFSIDALAKALCYLHNVCHDCYQCLTNSNYITVSTHPTSCRPAYLGLRRILGDSERNSFA